MSAGSPAVGAPPLAGPARSGRRRALLRGAAALLGAGAVLAGLAGAGSQTGGAAAQAQGQPEPQRLLIREGDTVTVDGADIGCQVDRRGRRLSLECRLVDHRRGTYTTILDERRARVARFQSKRTARTVYSAEHRR